MATTRANDGPSLDGKIDIARAADAAVPQR